MEFLLDITSPKVQKAMKALSITSDDLRVRTPQHFQLAGVPEHIQRLRYSHYTAKSASLANRVVNFLKHPSYAPAHKPSALCQYKSTFRESHNEKFKKNYEKALLSFYDLETRTRKSEVEVKLKVDRDQSIGNRLKEFVQNRKEKLESKFLKNKENLRILQLEHERKTLEAEKRVKKRRKSQSVCHSRERSARFQSATEEEDIESKLREISRKMNKSAENYQRSIQEKVQKIRMRDVRPNKSQTNNYEKLVNHIKKKQENAENRRIKLKEELQQRASAKESFSFERAKRNRNSYTAELQERELKGLEKNKRTQDFLLLVKLQQRNQIELKHEKHKLFEENVSENVSRQRKVLNDKKEKIIEKHLDLLERQREQTEYLEKTNRKTREKAMVFTLKREKIHELRSKISKSQTPEKLNQFLFFN